MNSLTSLFDQLAVALTAEPLLLLASAVAAFDPFWNTFDEEDIDYDADPLYIAVQVTRGAFPDIYAEAVEYLRAGASYQELDHLLCTAISAKGIPLDDLEAIGWGIPLHAVGVDLEDPEFYSVHSDLLPLLAPFGIDLPEGEMHSVDVPECVYPAGRAIAASLLEQTDPALQQVGWAFGWLFACTGNSLIDYTDEALSEIPPLSWSEEDVAFAIELIEEADGIMRDVQTGIKVILGTPNLLTRIEQLVLLHVSSIRKGEKTICIDVEKTLSKLCYA